MATQQHKTYCSLQSLFIYYLVANTSLCWGSSRFEVFSIVNKSLAVDPDVIFSEQAYNVLFTREENIEVRKI